MNPRGAPRGAPLLCLALLHLSQPAPSRYTAPMLDGAAFDERVRLSLRTQTGGATRLETIGREARWRVLAADSAGTIAIEAWYDSLHIWRDGPEGRLVPDTDGLVGGRYHGTIAPAGRVTVQVRPFVPDEIREVSDLGEALVTFLPVLPDEALAVGAVAADGRGWRIQRRPDSTSSDGVLRRYRWTRLAVDTVRQVEADSLAYEVWSTVREEGHVVWHPVLGPLAWQRDVLTEVEIPAQGPVRRAVRSRVEERLQGWRRRGPT